MGFWKKGDVSNLGILNDPQPGTIAGEGAAFFLMTDNEDPANYARISGLDTRFNPEKNDIAVDFIRGFLAAQKLGEADIDLLVLGLNGDPATDSVYEPVRQEFSGTAQAWFKHLSGEHYLASSFALWLAARIAKSQSLPGAILLNEAEEPGRIDNILIYNHHNNIHHSLILVSSC